MGSGFSQGQNPHCRSMWRKPTALFTVGGDWKGWEALREGDLLWIPDQRGLDTIQKSTQTLWCLSVFRVTFLDLFDCSDGMHSALFSYGILWNRLFVLGSLSKLSILCGNKYLDKNQKWASHQRILRGTKNIWERSHHLWYHYPG